jgi:hypothetical protein
MRIGAILAVAAGGWAAAPVGVAPAQSASELPPVELSSTTFREGDVITMSGTGCSDPDTGSGEGLVVVMRRPVDQGRGGTSAVLSTVEAPVAADGTFSGSGTIEQPLFPDGVQEAVVTCERPHPDEGRGDVFSGRFVEVTIVAPALPDLQVQAGTSFDLVLPCTIDGGEYGRFTIALEVPGQEDIYLVVPGSFPYETSPQEGDTVSIEVPAGAPAGTYEATAACTVSQAGTSAYYAGFTVTVLAADQAPAPPPTSAPTPGPATPVAGEARYTG